MKKSYLTFKYLSTFIPSKNYSSALTLHNIPQKSYRWFSNILDYLMEDYEFINPKNIESILNIKNSKKKLLLTFDDGYSSCLDICEKILNPRKIKALFFLTSSFIGLKNNDAFNFCRNNFYPNSELSKGNFHNCDAISTDDICSILKYGHSIGCHTSTHKNLSLISSKEIKDEINYSKDYLESIINEKIDFFAFPFGNLHSINYDSHNIAKNKFKYCFSNIRGGLYESPSRSFIFRHNLVPEMPVFLVKAIVEGKVDWKYEKSRIRAKMLYRK
tara:strand:+ start:3863 stop:4681 length:819 start_codon:yes stop_codon:yes gene_type:complete